MCTDRDVNHVADWLSKNKNEHRKLEEIPVEKLDLYLAEYFIDMKKPDGEEYAPGTVVSRKHGISRYLNVKDYGCDLADPRFKKTKQAMTAKKKYLENIGKYKSFFLGTFLSFIIVIETVCDFGHWPYALPNKNISGLVKVQ